MKKKLYQTPETIVIPVYSYNPLLSHSPGNIGTDPDPWDGDWDGKEDDFEEDEDDFIDIRVSKLSSEISPRETRTREWGEWKSILSD